MTDTAQYATSPPQSPNNSPPRPRRKHRALKIIGGIVGGLALLLAGVGIGAGSKTPKPVTVTKTVIKTVTHNVPVPGPTVTQTVTKTVRVRVRPAGAGGSMPGDGTFVVGTAAGDWAPGTWQTSAADSGNCYYATLTTLAGGTDDVNNIISNDNTSGPVVMDVGSGVGAVDVSGCNTWHKIG